MCIRDRCAKDYIEEDYWVKSTRLVSIRSYMHYIYVYIFVPLTYVYFSYQKEDYWERKAHNVGWRRNPRFIFRILQTVRIDRVRWVILQNHAYFYQVKIFFSLYFLYALKFWFIHVLLHQVIIFKREVFKTTITFKTEDIETSANTKINENYFTSNNTS